jgi:hypothetical protein
MRTKTAVERMEAQRFPAGELPDTPPFEETLWWRDREIDPDPAPADARPVRRRLLLAGAAALVGGLVLTPLTWRALHPQKPLRTPQTLQYVANPSSTSTREVLSDLAAKAATQPAAPGTGRYHYRHEKGYSLSEAVDGATGRRLSWQMVNTERETWVANDGSGRVIESTDGEKPVGPDTFGPGTLEGHFLPADATVAQLRSRFARSNHADTGPGWALALADLTGMQIVPPALQSRMLGILAQQSGLVLRGRTTDRAGRVGVAISADDTGDWGESRRTLIFDPATGALLDVEETALDVPDLPVEPGATISYTIYLSCGYTDSTATRP